jgi:hypothetical protein
VIATLKRARSFVPGNNRKLETGLAELRRLVQAQREIEKFHADVVNLLASYQQREREAELLYRTALQSGNVDEVRVAFESWIAIKPFVEVASVECGSLARAKAVGFPLQVLLSKNPNTKQVLLTVVECRLSAAKDEESRVKAEERARLDGSYDETDIAASPVVRRATSKVAHLETIKKRIESQPIESGWNLAAGLLDDE